MQKSSTSILSGATVSAGETSALASCTAVDNSRATQLAFSLKATINAAATGSITVYLYTSTDDTTYDTKYYDSWTIENIRKVGYDSGSSMFVIGETLTAASGGTGVVVNWTLGSGTWAGGDAAGYVYLSDISGTFANDDQLDGGTSGANCATEDGAIANTAIHSTYYPSTVCPAYYKARVANGDTGQSLTSVSVLATKQTI